ERAGGERTCDGTFLDFACGPPGPRQAPKKSSKERESAGTYVISGSRDKVLKLWDSSSGQCLHTFVGHDNWVRGAVLHPSGKYMLSASDDKSMKIWDLRTGRCQKTIEVHQHFCTCLAFNT